MNTNLSTVIVSAFPGCGKTYMAQNSERFNCACKDSDSSKYPKTPDRYQRYVDDIEKQIGKYDIIFVSQQEELLQELQKRSIPFIVIGPNQASSLSEKKRGLIKQQWFGRFFLRDNSHIDDFDNWITLIKEHWDEWTSFAHYAKYNPIDIIALNADQYISDVLNQIYWNTMEYDE